MSAAGRRQGLRTRQSALMTLKRPRGSRTSQLTLVCPGIALDSALPEDAVVGWSGNVPRRTSGSSWCGGMGNHGDDPRRPGRRQNAARTFKGLGGGRRTHSRSHRVGRLPCPFRSSGQRWCHVAGSPGRRDPVGRRTCHRGPGDLEHHFRTSEGDRRRYPRPRAGNGGKCPITGFYRADPAGGFVLASFTLRAGLGIENGEVDVLLQFRSGSPGWETAEQLVTGSLTLTAGTARQVPQAAFLSFPDKLNDGQSVRAAVSISNPTPFPVRQIQVAAVDSEDVTLSQVAPAEPPFVACPAGTAQGNTLVGCLGTLAPGATAVLYLQVTASSRVQTGTQHVAVVVTSQISTSADPVASTVVATTPVQVTIFGVDALSPFGLGTLFVLPGIVTALVFLLLARYVYPRRKELPESLQFTDARTMLLVVPPAALAYLLVWAFWSVNLTDQAGTEDVILLFGLGIGLGVIVWAAVAVIYYERSGRKQFTVTDTPDKVLQRLQARGARLVMPVVASGNVPYRYLSDGPSGQLVACPPVTYAVTDNADAEAGHRFRVALDANDIDAVRREFHHGNVSLNWQRQSGVTLLDRSTVQMQDPERLIPREVLPDGA